MVRCKSRSQCLRRPLPCSQTYPTITPTSRCHTCGCSRLVEGRIVEVPPSNGDGAGQADLLYVHPLVRNQRVVGRSGLSAFVSIVLSLLHVNLMCLLSVGQCQIRAREGTGDPARPPARDAEHGGAGLLHEPGRHDSRHVRAGGGQRACLHTCVLSTNCTEHFCTECLHSDASSVSEVLTDPVGPDGTAESAELPSFATGQEACDAAFEVRPRTHLRCRRECRALRSAAVWVVLRAAAGPSSG